MGQQQARSKPAESAFNAVEAGAQAAAANKAASSLAA